LNELVKHVNETEAPDDAPPVPQELEEDQEGIETNAAIVCITLTPSKHYTLLPQPLTRSSTPLPSVPLSHDNH
jgi:hypothetical protein